MDIQGQIKDAKKKLEEARFELEKAENNYDLEKAAVLRHGTIPELQTKLESLNNSNENKILRDKERLHTMAQKAKRCEMKGAMDNIMKEIKSITNKK